MSKKFYISVLIAITILSLGAVAFSQETTGGIEGTVRDSTGAIVPNVTVTIVTKQAGSGTTTTGAGAGFRRTITTDPEGFFRALQIPPGNYDVVTSPVSGFGEARYSNVVVAIGRNTQLEITVSPGGNVTTIDVSVSEAAPIDTTNSAIQTSINAQKMELLPKGTGFTSILRAVPGTRPESRTGGFSVDGASGAENSFVIDGQEVNNFRSGTLNDSYSIPTQIVREVQVKSSGFDAEFGGATGGVISVVTKGGSNDWHGEFGAQFETPKLAGTPRPLLTRFTSGSVAAGTFRQTAEVFQPQKIGGVNFFPTASLGGPIVKERLWFFSSYSPQIFDTNVTVPYYTDAPASTRTFIGEQSYRRSRKYEYAFARIDSNPFSKLRVSSTFLWNPIIDKGSVPSQSFSNVSSSALAFGNFPTANFGPGIGILTGNQFTDRQGGRQSSNLFTVEGVYTPTSNTVISGRYTRGFLNEKLGNYFVPEITRVVTCGNAPASFNCAITPANSITRKEVSIRQTYDLSAAYIFTGGGRHEVKMGYQRFEIFNDVARGNSTLGEITYSWGVAINTLKPGVTPTPGAVGAGRIRRGGTIGFGENLSQGIFLQDRWQPISRLSLNLGIRIEKENLPSFNQYPSNINFGWSDKIAPRLGFAYDLTGDGRTKIFASYGRFFDRVKFALPRGLYGGDIQLDDWFEIFPGQTAANFSLATIVGGFTGASVCPTTGFIMAGVLSRCQANGRVNVNDPAANARSGGAVDPNLRPFRQTEFTVGGERQVGRLYVMRMRYTYKNVDEVVEDAGFIYTAGGSEEYIIGNPGRGLHLQRLQEFGYINSTRPQRRYDGFEVVFERRLADDWYFHANYTLSRLFGNFTGLASSDEAHLLGGRTDPGVSRAFDLPHIGFTAEGTKDNGRLPTDRPHVFNIYGAYIFDWKGSRTNSTEISAFQTITSGTPMTTSIYGSSGTTPQIFRPRGDLGRSPVYSQTDLNITHRYRFGRDSRFTMAFDVNILNLFDQATLLSVYPTMNPSTARVDAAALGFTGDLRNVPYSNGYTSGTLLPAFLAYMAASPDRTDIRYKMPQQFQSPRAVRFGMRFMF